MGHVFLVSSQHAVLLPAIMRQQRAAPPSLLTAALALTFALAVSPRLTCGATPFPQDLEPISIVGRESKSLTLCCHGDYLGGGFLQRLGETRPIYIFLSSSWILLR